MNKRKYRDKYYEPRQLTDLRDLVDSSARLYGNRPAFLVKDKHGEPYRPISYSQMRMDVNALGTMFVKLGLKDKKIAVIGENSYEWVVAYFATVCGAGVIVPIDRELPAAEVANLLDRSGASAIVHSVKIAGKVCEALAVTKNKINTVIGMGADACEGDTHCIAELIKQGKEALYDGDDSYVGAEIEPDEMCALLFTSGTTGMAKGVMLSHTNIVANVYNMSKYVSVEGIGLSVLPMHHSYEMTCHILTGLFQGISIAICEGLKYIQSNFAEVHANIMLGVPLIFESIHKKLMKQAKAKGKLEDLQRGIELSRRFKLYNRPSVTRQMFKDVHEALGGGRVTHFIAGGAAINPRVIEDFEAMGFPMFQGYGMTENAPIIAVNRDRYSKADSAGYAMPGTEIRIDDADENGLGEVVIKGPSVMLGYYENDEDTDRTLKDGWLYTGDYGYLDDEGFLYITGRKKSVIVTKNGKNVFPEEIEFYLTESGFIEEALVHEVESMTGEDTVIKAEIYPNFHNIYSELEREADEDEVRDFIAGLIDDINDEMPPYKRIKRFGIRDTEFVKTTTRKIKRYVPENLESEKKE